MKTNELNQQEMQETNGGMSVLPTGYSPYASQSNEPMTANGMDAQPGSAEGNDPGSMNANPGMGGSQQDHPNYVK